MKKSMRPLQLSLPVAAGARAVSLAPAGLSDLQAMADASRVVQRFQELQSMANPPATAASPVQRVKTAPDQPALKYNAYIGENLKLKEAPATRINANDTTPTQAELVFDAAQVDYRYCLAKGTALWKDLLDATYAHDTTDPEFQQAQALNRERNESLWSSAYTTDDLNEWHAVTYGLHPGSGEKGEKAAYTNVIDLDKGFVRADDIKASRDPNREQANDAGFLNYSEVTWQQMRAKAATKYGAENEAKIAEALADLNQVTHQNVSNPQTHRAVYFALPNNTLWGDGSYSWGPKDEEFLATLGTPNGKPVAYMLKDHTDELRGKQIDSVTAGPQSSLDFKLAEGIEGQFEQMSTLIPENNDNDN